MVMMVTFFSSEVAGDPVMSRIFCRFHWEQQRETVTICDQWGKKAGHLRLTPTEYAACHIQKKTRNFWM
jgi:hypothetical protein